MLISVFFLALIDNIVYVDLLFFIPEEFKNLVNLEKIGIMDLFTILFILFEMLSILKNMILCKLPIPKKFQEKLQEIMKEYTEEIKED